MDVHYRLPIAAALAQISVPDLNKEWDSKDFPHFFVLAKIQQGSIYAAMHNAQIIGRLSKREVVSLSYLDAVRLGLRIPNN